jgi:hypothetical protein
LIEFYYFYRLLPRPVLLVCGGCYYHCRRALFDID